MKYAVLGPKGAVIRLSDKEPQFHPENGSVVQLNDSQVEKVETGNSSTPRVLYFYVDGELLTIQEKIERERPPLTQEQCIRKAERFIENKGFTAARLVILMDRMLQIKDQNIMEQFPKIVAAYAWIQSIKATAIQGFVDFEDPPFTFEEILIEGS